MLYCGLVRTLFQGVCRIRLISDRRCVLSSRRECRGYVASYLDGCSRANVCRGGDRVNNQATNCRVANVLFIPQDVDGSGFAIVNEGMTVDRVGHGTLFALYFRTVRRRNVVGIFTNVTRPLTVALRYVGLVLVRFFTVRRRASSRYELSIVCQAYYRRAGRVLLFVLVRGYFCVWFVYRDYGIWGCPSHFFYSVLPS